MKMINQRKADKKPKEFIMKSLRSRTIQACLAHPCITLKGVNEVGVHFCSHPAETTHKPISCIS